MHSLTDHSFRIFPVSRFEDQAADEDQLHIPLPWNFNHPVSFFAFEPQPGQELAAQGGPVHGCQSRSADGIGQSGLFRQGEAACQFFIQPEGIPRGVGVEGQGKGLLEEILKIVDHFFGQCA